MRVALAVVLAFILGAITKPDVMGELHATRRVLLPRDTDWQATRLTSYPGKVEIPCPPNPDFVILIAGQSNAGNHAGQKFKSNAVNFFGGKCYRAESPLLGSSGTGGDAFTLLASKLPGTVVLIPAAVGATHIETWAYGDGKVILDRVIAQVPWKITHTIWHQGESDRDTDPEDYAKSLATVMQRLPGKVISAVATVCNGAPVERIAAVQRKYATIDTDALVTDMDRIGCHFSYTGQVKFAEALAEVIAP